MGRFQVDRHDQHGHLARGDQVGHDGRGVDEFLGHGADERLAQFQHALALRSYRLDKRGFCRIELLDKFSRRPGDVGLVEDHDHGYFTLPKFVENSLFERTEFAGRHDQNTHVGAVEDLPGLLDTLLPQGTHVVDAGRVDKQHRADGQQFHGLFNRIGGCAGHLGNDGNLLPRHRV